MRHPPPSRPSLPRVTSPFRLEGQAVVHQDDNTYPPPPHHLSDVQETSIYFPWRRRIRLRGATLIQGEYETLPTIKPSNNQIPR